MNSRVSGQSSHAILAVLLCFFKYCLYIQKSLNVLNLQVHNVHQLNIKGSEAVIIGMKLELYNILMSRFHYVQIIVYACFYLLII